MIAVAGPFLFADTIPVALSAIEFCAGLVLNPAQTIDLTAALTSLRETRGTLGAVAVVSAFTGGLQFLPSSFMAGGTAILYLAEAFHGEPLPPRLLELIHRLFFGVAVALLILATIAIVR
jgi:membrane-associated protease RseP (regulator of RpoE activity)